MSDFGFGQFSPGDAASDFDKQMFLIRQALGLMRIMTVVQVIAVTNNGNIAPAGTVDVLPLVMQLDGQGNATPHATVFGLPYFRLQGGQNAVICDPVVGDIGLALISDRDISSVKTTKAQAPPSSLRRFSLSDGVYVGGILNAAPKQYVAFTPTGITIADMNGNSIVMAPGGITINKVLFDNSTAFNANTHSHPQGADSHGDAEENVGAPIPGS